MDGWGDEGSLRTAVDPELDKLVICRHFAFMTPFDLVKLHNGSYTRDFGGATSFQGSD